MKTEAITLTRDLGELGQEIDVEFVVRYWPGTPESGCFGPPENYDPGSDDVVSIISAMTVVFGQPVDITALYQNAGPDDLLDALCDACRESKAEDAHIRADAMIKERKEEMMLERLAA